jgi:hypothetical protein
MVHTNKPVSVQWVAMGWTTEFYCQRVPLSAVPHFQLMSTGRLSTGIKRLKRVADQTTKSSGEIKNEWSYTFIP